MYVGVCRYKQEFLTVGDQLKHSYCKHKQKLHYFGSQSSVYILRALKIRGSLNYLASKSVGNIRSNSVLQLTNTT